MLESLKLPRTPLKKKGEACSIFCRLCGRSKTRGNDLQLKQTALGGGFPNIETVCNVCVFKLAIPVAVSMSTTPGGDTEISSFYLTAKALASVRRSDGTRAETY